jgi:hypothetical protein
LRFAPAFAVEKTVPGYRAGKLQIHLNTVDTLTHGPSTPPTSLSRSLLPGESLPAVHRRQIPAPPDWPVPAPPGSPSIATPSFTATVAGPAGWRFPGSHRRPSSSSLPRPPPPPPPCQRVARVRPGRLQGGATRRSAPRGDAPHQAWGFVGWKSSPDILYLSPACCDPWTDLRDEGHGSGCDGPDGCAFVQVM